MRERDGGTIRRKRLPKESRPDAIRCLACIFFWTRGCFRFPDVFIQVRFIGVLPSGECRSLNLLREDVQDAIMSFSGDESAELLADERYSNRYE